MPNEWSYELATEVVRDYVKRNFVDEGMCVQFAIHDSENPITHQRNLHCHMMMTMRPILEDGSWGDKQKKVYALDADGNKIRKKNGQYKCTTQDVTGWNNRDNAKRWRKDWADTINAVNEKNGLTDNFWEHRSFEEQGLDIIPQIHLGAKASALERKGIPTALLDACKEVKGSEPVQIGSYRGFTMSVEFSAWKQEYTLLLKGQMTHRASLGTDPRGNLTRIDNALAQMPQRLEAVKNQLDNLYQQQAAAKEEIGKPFPFEDDLRVKSARLVELDTLLNIDGKGHAQPETVVAKSARPSVLDSLKRPVPPRSPEKKPKQHEEVR